MKVTIISTDGSHVEVEDFNDQTVMEMVEALSDETIHVLAVAMDDGMAYIVKRNIARIDVD